MASRYICRREEAEDPSSLASFAGSSADRSPHIRQWVPVTRLGREEGGSLKMGVREAVLMFLGCIPYFFFVCLPIGFLNQEQPHFDSQGLSQGFLQQLSWPRVCACPLSPQVVGCRVRDPVVSRPMFRMLAEAIRRDAVLGLLSSQPASKQGRSPPATPV